MNVVQRQGELYKERQLEKYRKQQINSMVRNATIQKVNARNEFLNINRNKQGNVRKSMDTLMP
jgi:hypothetical protein